MFRQFDLDKQATQQLVLGHHENSRFWLSIISVTIESDGSQTKGCCTNGLGNSRVPKSVGSNFAAEYDIIFLYAQNLLTKVSDVACKLACKCRAFRQSC